MPLLSESKFGMQIGVMEPTVGRLNPGEVQEVTVYVSSYGRPAKHTSVTLESFLTEADSLCTSEACPS